MGGLTMTMTIRMISIPISDENYIDDLRQLTNIGKY